MISKDYEHFWWWGDWGTDFWGFGLEKKKSSKKVRLRASHLNIGVSLLSLRLPHPANMEEATSLGGITATEHASNAITTSYELGPFNAPKLDSSDIREHSDHIHGTLSIPVDLDEAAVVPRSRLRLFTVMAALFVSLSLLVSCIFSVHISSMISGFGLATD